MNLNVRKKLHNKKEEQSKSKCLIHAPNKLPCQSKQTKIVSKNHSGIDWVYIQEQEIQSKYIHQACHVALEHLY